MAPISRNRELQPEEVAEAVAYVRRHRDGDAAFDVVVSGGTGPAAMLDGVRERQQAPYRQRGGAVLARSTSFVASSSRVCSGVPPCTRFNTIRAAAAPISRNG